MELEIWSKASFGNIKGQHLPFRARFYSRPRFLKAEARVLLRTFPQGEEPEDSENTGERKQPRPETVISEVINWGAGATGRIISVSPGSVITELFAKWRVMEQTVCQWSQAKLANEVTQIPPSGEGLEGTELVEAAPNAPGESHSFLEGFEQERIHTGLWNYADRRLPIKPGDRRFGPMKTCQATEILLLVVMVWEMKRKREKKSSNHHSFPIWEDGAWER